MLVPFTLDGKEMKPWGYDYPPQYAMRFVEPFNSVLRFKSKVSSALFVVWEDVFTGTLFHMHLTELTAVLQKGNFQEESGAIVDGRWGVRKRYGLYTLYMITE
jgi:hypothetical protein